MISQDKKKTNQKSPKPRIEVRCIDCDCSPPDRRGKILGALIGVPPVLMELLRAAGVQLELPCQTKKSKRRLVTL